MVRSRTKRVLRPAMFSVAAILMIYPAYATAPDTVTASLASIPSPFTGAISPDGTFVYTMGYANSTLYRVNASTTTLEKTVSLSNSSSLRQIRFLPDGSAALYIDNSNGKLHKINTSTDLVTASVSIGATPNQFAISKDGRYIYVGYAGYPTSIKRFLTSDLSLDTTYNFTIGVRSVSISPDGTQGYAVGASQVVPFNTTTGVAGTPLTLGTCASLNGTNYTVDGSAVYFLCATPNASIYHVNPATNSIVGSPISLGSSGYEMAVSPEGSFIYIQAYSANSIYRLRLSDDTISNTITSVSGPYGIAISDDATFAYSFNYGSSTISRIYTGAIMAQRESVALTLVGGGNSAVYRASNTIRFTISSPASGGDGKVTFFQNGTRIAGCINVASTSNIANCTYKPTIHGFARITATIIPTSNSYLTSYAPALNLGIITRTSKR